MRDPQSADRNAQAPEGHPDAQVRVDQNNVRRGVQQPVYRPAVPAPAAAPSPDPVTGPGAEPVVTTPVTDTTSSDVQEGRPDDSADQHD